MLLMLTQWLGSGFDLTEAGTQKRLAIYAVTSLDEVRASSRSTPTRWPTTSPPGSRGDPSARRTLSAQGRAARPAHHRRDRQRLLRRDPARRPAQPVQARQRAQPRGTGTPVRGDQGELAEAIERSAAWRPKTSRATRSSTCACMGGPVRRPARSAVPRSPRCRSRIPPCSTAPPARPAASPWPIDVVTASEVAEPAWPTPGDGQCPGPPGAGNSPVTPVNGRVRSRAAASLSSPGTLRPVPSHQE